MQSPAEIEGALSRTGDSPGWGMIALPDVFVFVHRKLLSDLAARHRVPAVYPLRAHVTSGGLMSYGVDFNDLYARAAVYVDRILKGEKPSALPVQGPVQFETIINREAASALGLEVPVSLATQADERCGHCDEG
jgi:putative ABC transport system substrate-binding protein